MNTWIQREDGSWAVRLCGQRHLINIVGKPQNQREFALGDTVIDRHGTVQYVGPEIVKTEDSARQGAGRCSLVYGAS